MAQLLLLSSAHTGPAHTGPAHKSHAHASQTHAHDPQEVPLASLEFLPHSVRREPLHTGALLEAADCDAILIDARRELAQAKAMCATIRASAIDRPIIVIITEGGWAAMNGDWLLTEVVLNTAGPSELEARIRLACSASTSSNTASNAAGGAAGAAASAGAHQIQASGLTIDEANYSAHAKGKPLDLTYKEFELLRFLAAHPSRVHTREQLLSEVWGYDYYGGTRTVDVHVRRLRAKLGDLEQLIGTVRNVGYRFILAEEPNEPGHD